MSTIVKARRHSLTEAVQLQIDKKGPKLCQCAHPNCAHCLHNLPAALSNIFNHKHSENDFTEGIQLPREAMGLCPLHRGTCLSRLANALSSRYNHTCSEEDLSETIQLLREALELCHLGHPHRNAALNNLAIALSDRYHRTGSEDDLVERIQLLREALELCPLGHPHRNTCLNNLANALGSRYSRIGSEDDLAERIRMLSEALNLCPPGHPHRNMCLNNLANALGDQYHRTGSEDDLAERIRLHKEALELCSPNHPYYETVLNNLANTLSDRYRLTGSENDLVEMIWLHRAALKLCPPNHPTRDMSLNNLAIVLSRRYNRIGSEDDLTETIRLHREALELRPPGHPRRDASLDNLANALGAQYRCTGSENDLAERILLHREALELRSPGHPARNISLNNLAGALFDRDSSTGSLAEISFAESVRLLREALELCPLGHPRHAAALCMLARSIWHSTNAPSNIDEVFRLLKEGSTDIVSPITDSLECARRWVVWARGIHHNTLSDAYNHSIQSLRRYLTIGPTVKLQYEALTRQAGFLSLPMDAAAHFILNGDVGRAVEILDEGRSLLWSEMRRFREPLLHPALVGDELAALFDATCSELKHISTAEAKYVTTSTHGILRCSCTGPLSTGISYDMLLDRKRKLLHTFDEQLGLIRKKAGFEDFLTSPRFKKLQKSAQEGPVIIVNCSRLGSHVIIVFADRSPSVITLVADFHQKAVSIHKQYLDALHVTATARDASRAFGYKLAPIVLQLWNLVVLKVVKELEMLGVPKGSRVWWCPTSVLTALPLHAAGDGTCYFIDSYVSSYTPTLTALINAREASFQPAIRGPEVQPRLLVVAQTIDSGLEFAGDELANMRSLGPWVDVLDGPEATRQSVLESLPDHSWVHFICHGTLSESGDPFDSSLHLHGDTLSVNDIIKAHLPDAEFAFLAACHTAEQARSKSVLQDEILHIAGAMQFSGFRSVVGTMWEMEDNDGPKVAKLFYAEMLKGDTYSSQRHTRAARALSKVIRRMMAKGVSMDRWANFVHIGA